MQAGAKVFSVVVLLAAACGSKGDGGAFDLSALTGGSGADLLGADPKDTPKAGKTADKAASGDAKAGSDNVLADATGPTVARPVAGARNTVSGPAAARFTAWTPLHQFLGAPTVGGLVISPKEAIVFTRDNHVGVTLDGGVAWGWGRITNGAVWSVAGAPGGPYVVAGAKGFIAISTDGKTWTDLPRLINDDLHTVKVAGKRIVAIGKNGGVITVGADGSRPTSGYFPDKFKAAGIVVDGDVITAVAGKKAMQSSDGLAWTAIEPPAATTAPGMATSQGLCGVGTVSKRKSAVCTVDGVAYGIGPTETIVVGKAWIGVTTTGKSWAMAPLPFKTIKNVAGKPGGPYHVGDGKGLVASSPDGKAWKFGTDPTVLDGMPAFVPRAGKCEGVLPAAQETCKLTRSVASPAGMPEVRLVRFTGDVGLAMGDSALVAMTSDGGATWASHAGYGLGGIQAFDLAGDKVAAIGLKKVAVSTDGGKQFRTLELPPKTPLLLGARIMADGSLIVVGRMGTILKADASLGALAPLLTWPKNKSDYAYIHEAGGAIFVAGTRGELIRSGDGGSTWTPIATGLSVPLQKMASAGDTVLAVSSPARGSGNKLLRSGDGGQRFFVQRELSDQGTVHEFTFDGTVLTYNGMRSSDFGATWATAGEWYWEGSVDVADGSGVRIANSSRYDSKDRFYVIGPTEGDLTVVDSFFNKGGWLRCEQSSGCWMVAGGQLYRPS